MKVDERKLIEWCVEIGVSRGIMRAHKHSDTPSRDDLEAAIYRAVIEEVNEWFSFEGARNELC